MTPDVSGHWQGVYSYPGEMDAVRFDAWLTDAGGMLCGETAEAGLPGETSAVAYALVSGSRSGRRVAFTKIYDALGYEPIDYQGELDDSGEEIHGRWSIPGHGSGSFLMKRSVAAAEQEEQADEAVEESA